MTEGTNPSRPPAIVSPAQLHAAFGVLATTVLKW